jgi:hypothetical protein
MSKSFLNIIFIISLLISCNDVLSQVFTPGDFNDGIYVKENSQNKKPIPYTSLRESDVQWSKRVWRKIDLREKKDSGMFFLAKGIAGKVAGVESQHLKTNHRHPIVEPILDIYKQLRG